MTAVSTYMDRAGGVDFVGGSEGLVGAVGRFSNRYIGSLGSIVTIFDRGKRTTTPSRDSNMTRLKAAMAHQHQNTGIFIFTQLTPPPTPPARHDHKIKASLFAVILF